MKNQRKRFPGRRKYNCKVSEVQMWLVWSKDGSKAWAAGDGTWGRRWHAFSLRHMERQDRERLCRAS